MYNTDNVITQVQEAGTQAVKKCWMWNPIMMCTTQKEVKTFLGTAAAAAGAGRAATNP